MTQYVVKVLISAALIVLVSDVGKRSAVLAGLLASLPLVSYLGMIWLYLDTRDAQKVSELSTSIFWLVLPSLSLFIVLPLLLKRMHFAPSLLLSTLVMFTCYGLMILALRRLGGS
jgi:F0F1-type ATP synthase assembly protein I